MEAIPGFQLTKNSGLSILTISTRKEMVPWSSNAMYIVKRTLLILDTMHRMPCHYHSFTGLCL